MGYEPRIKGVENAEALAAGALDLWISGARSAVASGRAFYAAVSGGHTPEPFFRLLGQSGEARSLAWGRIHVFWADERYVPPDHPDSNYGLAHRTFLRAVSIPASNVHRVPTDLATPCDAVRCYEEDLRKTFEVHGDEAPSFDLIFLGMGPDGHTASLFPYSFAATDIEHLAGLVSRPEGPCRVTLTPKVLHAARQVVVLVSGKDKASVLGEILTRDPDPLRYPIHVLWPILDRVLWLADREALALWA